MASRKEHIEKAEKLFEEAKKSDRQGCHSSAAQKREDARDHLAVAEAKRGGREVYGTTRIPRGRR